MMRFFTLGIICLLFAGCAADEEEVVSIVLINSGAADMATERYHYETNVSFDIDCNHEEGCDLELNYGLELNDDSGSTIYNVKRLDNGEEREISFRQGNAYYVWNGGAVFLNLPEGKTPFQSSYVRGDPAEHSLVAISAHWEKVGVMACPEDMNLLPCCMHECEEGEMYCDENDNMISCEESSEGCRQLTTFACGFGTVCFDDVGCQLPE